MKPVTKSDYHQRMLRVLIYIQQHLDDSLGLEELAKVAHFSPYHFHRVFRGMIGESLQKHVRRLRLERAAHRLKNTGQSVTTIALEAGYESHEAFTRTFRSMFDDSPTGFRDKVQPLAFKQVGASIHYVANGALGGFESVSYGENKMDVKVETIDPMRVIFMRHTGPYDQVGDTWMSLYSWAGPRGFVGPTSIAFGVVYDDPDVTPPERLRCDACIIVDRVVEPEGAVALQQIAGGAYAVTRHVGPYSEFSITYARLFGEWLPKSGREVRSAPALEFYRNAPMNTKPEDLITDIYIPLEDQP